MAAAIADCCGDVDVASIVKVSGAACLAVLKHRLCCASVALYAWWGAVQNRFIIFVVANSAAATAAVVAVCFGPELFSAFVDVCKNLSTKEFRKYIYNQTKKKKKPEKKTKFKFCSICASLSFISHTLSLSLSVSLLRLLSGSHFVFCGRLKNVFGLNITATATFMAKSYGHL